MLAASAILLCAVLLRLSLIWSDHGHQQRALDALEARAAPAPRQRAPVDPADIARGKVARQVAQHLVTPWADLLDTLESARIESVALLSVEPSVSKRTVRLMAEARDAQVMLTYLGTLQRDPRLSSVMLVSHEVQLKSPGTPVRFQIQAGWGALP
jgi:Tfp pilus assembly protein PilN